MEKVIKGLECCVYDHCDPKDCPYFGRCTDDKQCSDVLLLDAANALKAQEPRMMTLEAAMSLRFDDVVYVELYPTGAIISAIVIDVIPRMPNSEIGLVQFRHIQEPTNNADLEYYNKTWRCWTSRPTNEQMEEVKWGE